MKKIIAIAMIVILAVTAVVGTTLAYFTDEEGAVNIMTVGNVQIKQNEYETKEDGELQDFTQGQALNPVVGTAEKKNVTVDGWNIQIRDNTKYKNYIEKIVNVTNTGVNDAYVRTIIAFPEAGNFDTTWNAAEQWLHWNGVSNTDTNPNNGWIWGKDTTTDWPGNTDNWDVVENVTIGGRKYDLYIVTNRNPLKPDETTAPNLVGFFMDERVEYDDDNKCYTFTTQDGTVYNLGDISHLEILVATQAVQVDGFGDAWTALDTAFGDITDDNHPWANHDVVKVTAGEYYVKDTIVVGEGETDAVTASGNGTVVTITGGRYDAADKDTAVWAMDGAQVVIEDGYFICDGFGVEATSDNHQDLIYAGANDGSIVIKGGHFEARSEGAWLLNEKDGQGTIVVTGGTFVNWNPANNVSEGAGTSFVADGYKVIEEKHGNDTWYIVVAA